MLKGIVNAKSIYKSDAHNIIYDEDEILYIGDDISKFELDETIDATGLSVYPGFNDSHMHLLNLGFILSKINLSSCTSLKEIYSILKEAVNSDEKWIIARGFNEDKLEEKAYPSKEMLDEISPDKPICLLRACGHIMVCNSKALSRAGMEDDIEGNNYRVNIKDGIVEENAIEEVKQAWPLETVQSISDHILRACDKCHEYGITAVGSDDFISITSEYDEVLEAFEKLAFQRKLSLRVTEQVHFNSYEDYEQFLHDGYTYDVGNELFRVGPLKLIMDGSLGARSALLSGKYNDDAEAKGLQVLSSLELQRYLVMAMRYNMPFAIHVIGDKALDIVLDTYEKIKIEGNVLPNGLVHVQITKPEQVQRIIDNKLHCYIQSIFIDYDGTIVRDRVGDLADSSYAFKTLLENTNVSNGSDCPVEMCDVIKGIYTAVTRKDCNGNVLNASEAMSVSQAIDSFTKNGYISLEDTNVGEIKVGYKCDFALLDQDLEIIDPEDIINTKVMMTIFDSNVVYDNH